VWAATQGPGLAQRLVADRLGLELADVAIHTTLIGGGFGRRIPQDYVLEAVDVSARVRRPVKVVWSREDDLGNDFYRPIAVSRLRGGLDARGAIVGWRHRLASPSILVGGVGDFIAGAAASAPRALRRLAGGIAARSLARGLIADASTAEGAAELPYAIGAIRVEVIQPELGVPVGFWRAVGHSHTALVTEAFLDELLAAGGQDPYLGRRALLAARPALRAVLDLAAAKAGWGAPLPAGVGRGIAVHESFGTRCAQVVEAVVRGGRVRVRRVVAAIDCGQVINPQLVVAQVEGAIIFGLSAALKQAITLQDGVVEQRNFGDYRALRMAECPVIEVHLMPSDAPPTGVGEPGLPPVAPALLGAIFAASGIRIRRLPIEPALREAAR
jgi:CO/xanthine dehydrogenase Mo-binding subunit